MDGTVLLQAVTYDAVKCQYNNNYALMLHIFLGNDMIKLFII